MNMQIIFLLLPTLPASCPNQFDFQNCLMNTRLMACPLFSLLLKGQDVWLFIQFLSSETGIRLAGADPLSAGHIDLCQQEQLFITRKGNTVPMII